MLDPEPHLSELTIGALAANGAVRKRTVGSSFTRCSENKHVLPAVLEPTAILVGRCREMEGEITCEDLSHFVDKGKSQQTDWHVRRGSKWGRSSNPGYLTSRDHTESSDDPKSFLCPQIFLKGEIRLWGQAVTLLRYTLKGRIGVL